MSGTLILLAFFAGCVVTWIICEEIKRREIRTERELHIRQLERLGYLR